MNDKILCKYHSIENGITVSAFPEYDVLNNIIDIHMPFSFDTDERYYPAHLIKISEND